MIESEATMDAFFRVLGFDCYEKHRFAELLEPRPALKSMRSEDVDGTGTVSCELSLPS